MWGTGSLRFSYPLPHHFKKSMRVFWLFSIEWNQLFFAVKNQRYKQTCQFEHVKSSLFTKMTKGTTTLWLRALLQHHFLCVWIWIHFWQNLPGNNLFMARKLMSWWGVMEKIGKQSAKKQSLLINAYWSFPWKKNQQFPIGVTGKPQQDFEEDTPHMGVSENG